MTPTTLYYECPVSEALPERPAKGYVTPFHTDIGIVYFTEHGYFADEEGNTERVEWWLRPLDLSHPPEMSNESIRQAYDNYPDDQIDFNREDAFCKGMTLARSIYSAHFTAMQKAMSDQEERIKELEAVCEETLRLLKKWNKTGEWIPLKEKLSALTSKP